MNENIKELFPGIEIPDYDLTGVMRLLAAFEPDQFAEVASDCLMRILDGMCTGMIKQSPQMTETVFILKSIYRTFRAVGYNRDDFERAVMRQMDNKSGFYTLMQELMPDYPEG